MNCKFRIFYFIFFLLSSQSVVSQNIPDSLIKIEKRTHSLDSTSSTAKFTKPIDSTQTLKNATLTNPLESTVDSNKVEYFFLNNENDLTYHAIDTNLYKVEIYHPGLFFDERFYATLGNLGLASNLMHYKTNIKNIGFVNADDGFSVYSFNLNTQKLYKLIRPYSEVFYMTASKKEQYFDFIHAQRLGKRNVMALEYRLMNSPGRYIKQGVQNANFMINNKFTSKYSRYIAVLAYSHNRINVSENGGILDAADFDTIENKYEANVYFTEDHATKNWKKEHFYSLNQYLGLGKRLQKDSSVKVNDYALGYLQHSLLYTRQWAIYTDAKPTSGYYENVYNSTSSTFDSVYYRNLENKVSWANFGNGIYRKKVNFSVGLTSQLARSAQNEAMYNYNSFSFYDTVYFNDDTNVNQLYINENEVSNVIANSKIVVNQLLGFNLIADFDYVFEGYNIEDYRFNAEISRNINLLQVRFGVTSSLREPDWLMLKNRSNHFRWENNFEKIFENSAFARFEYKTLSLQTNWYNVVNYTHLNYFCLPSQYEKNLQIFELKLNKLFRFWSFDFDNLIVYQKSSNNNVIHLPEFLTMQSLYWNANWKKHAQLQLGVDVRYNSKYYADAYMPALRSFYLQKEIKIGDYPFIDMFFAFKIKSARVFLKLDHLNANMMGTRYYYIPQYPYDGRAFKLGIKWKFAGLSR